ncbi:DUF4247 domain-containing protein [Paenibacillus validus]|uniref:DUF4247 domain-containing protein n=1 Tax=Paenibacillus validus TaxID=44253 RepID=A0A7X2ZAN7_9BACL|nr:MULTISPECIES: DUF4247 domain-containing protein [Paenibacillus]MED4602479.1 DUF4247 domain-containing protein [Paenibacillus validus]MED4608363.1 DUF4247 domain-containing protein [Paenibacillus validus]MUG71419.1 DUF4247 domain-containing protein [Paenibacillus validus]
MKRAARWLALVLVFALLAGCGDSGNFIKENYSLIDVQGQGKSTAKIYSVTGKDVPTVAHELEQQEKPQEISKESTERMFLVYDNKIIHVQKDPDNENTTLVELDTIQYAKDNYDSSFLQGYLTATLIQSVFGGGWFNSHRGYDYRGYTSSKRYDDYGKYQTAPYPSASAPAKTPAQTAPSTSDRKGSFTTTPTKPSTGAGSSSGSVRRNDGSTPSYGKAPSSGSSKPSTSKRSGSFKRK